MSKESLATYNLRLDQEEKNKIALKRYRRRYDQLEDEEKAEVDSTFWSKFAPPWSKGPSKKK